MNKKKILILIFLAYTNAISANEHWNNAYQTVMSIQPGSSQEEVDEKLDEAHNNLAQLNNQLRNGLFNNNSQSRECMVSQPSNTNTDLSRYATSLETDKTKIHSKITNVNNKRSRKKALILAGCALGGWACYQKKDQIIEYCSTIDNKKLLKTCLCVGAGSAVLIACLYSYKKIVHSKIHVTDNSSSVPKKKTLDYSSLSIEELQAVTAENEKKIADMNTRQRATMQASEKRSHEVKKRAEKVDNESDIAGIASDLGNAFKDVLKDPLTPARELINDAQSKINTARRALNKKWNQFLDWLHG